MEISVIGSMLGFLAGTILIYSGWPALKDLLRKPHHGTQGERRSRFFMMIGNTIWVISGIMTANIAIIIMCGINVLIQSAIWFRMKQSH